MFSARSSTLSVARPSALSIVSTLGLVAASAGCGPTGDSIVLAATTSTYDSGLLDSLVARFKTEHPDYSVRSVVVGSGQALELGRRGDADVLLVHAPEAEERFMADGHGVDRVPVMYNDFVLVGPPDDPAGVRGVPEAARALATIVEAGARFVSRGDDSGTHLREMALWRTAGVAPQGPWSYTLVDRATLSTLRRLLRLQPLVQGDPALVNLYSVIRTSRAAHPVEASVFADWLTSEEARLMIANFGSDEAGYPLYTPLVVGATLPIPSTTPKP
jgi:tungstate transport system substrate-binding protein